MPKQVCTGGMMTCTMGASPASIVVTPHMVKAGGPDAANIMDHKPTVNIPPFGVCKSPSNPTVASATAAASGVLTPMPCVPNTPAPWIVGSPTVLIGNMPALNDTNKCMCIWGGTISFTNAGQVTVNIP